MPPPEERLDHGWLKVAATQRYPALWKLAKAAISIFHGLRVESTFSLMKTILHPGTSRLNTATVSAVQTVKYAFHAQKKSAVQCFKRQKGEIINKKMVTNFQLASSRRRSDLAKKKAERER